MKERIKKVSCIIFFSLIIIPVMSQSIFGIKGGVQMARITGFQGLSQGFLTTMQAKFVGIMPVSDEVSITPSLGYSGKGYRLTNIQFTDQLGNDVGQGNINGLFNYIQLSLPLSYKFALDKTKDLYVGAGPYVAYAISGRGKVKNVAVQTTLDDWNLFSDDFYKRFDAGMVIEFTSTINKRFLASVNADIGLANISNGSGAKLKQIAAGLSIGYLLNSK